MKQTARTSDQENIYEQLKAINAEMDSHESDLYVKATPEVIELIKGLNYSFFTNQITGDKWVDIPFMYSPWWEERASKKAVR